MEFHKGCQIENCLIYFLYLTKEPNIHLNVKELANHCTIVFQNIFKFKIQDFKNIPKQKCMR